MKTLFKKTLLYLSIILAICLAISFIYTKNSQDLNLSFGEIFSNTIFIINTGLMCFALLSFITERGLFNPMRYSVRQVRSIISPKFKMEYMSTHNIKDESKIKNHMKEELLYTRSKFGYTFPLLISTVGIFIIQLIITAVMY